MEIFLRIIGYLSIVLVMISFGFMIRNLRRGRHLTIRSLIIPILMSILLLGVYYYLLGTAGLTAISIGLMVLGFILGMLWSRTTKLSIKGNSVHAKRSIGYLVIWGISIVITQFMAVAATPELASYGVSTIFFSTGLAVSNNAGLLVRRQQNLKRTKSKMACPSCGALNSSEVSFCIKCGQPLEK